MLSHLQDSVPGCIGAARDSEGFRLDFKDGSSRKATPEEVSAAALASITAAIKAERDRRKELGVPVGPYRFHSDADSRIQQLGLVMLGANMPDGLVWRTMGGVNAPMTPTLAQQVFGATVQRDGALFAAADAHIAAAAKLEDPLTYDFSTGWPD
jgi:hypothetical protein